MPKTPTSTASDAKKKLKPLILHLDKKGLRTNEGENDELYSSTVQTPTPTSKSVKGGDNNNEDIDVVSSTPDRIRVKVESQLEASKKLKCPCGQHDGDSTYVTCAKCTQGWHSRCSNLTGIGQTAVKKLEFWQCPRCYRCPLLSRIPATLYADIVLMRGRLRSCKKVSP